MPLTYSLIAVAGIILIFWSSLFEYGMRILKRTVFANSNKSTGRKIVNLFRFIWYPFILIVVAGLLGLNLVGLLAGAGFLGIILGLALQAPMSNFFAGIYIALSRIVKEGDTVKVNSIGSNIFVEGVIHHIGLSHVELEIVDGIIKYIPNNLMITSIIEKVDAEAKLDAKGST